MKSLKEYKEGIEEIYCTCPVCGDRTLRDFFDEEYETLNKEMVYITVSMGCAECETIITETHLLVKVQIKTKEGDIETLTNSHENEHKLEKDINI